MNSTYQSDGREMNRRFFARSTAGVFFSLGALYGQVGWQLRFEKVHDLLLVRVGGPKGPLIYWKDRGAVMGGQYTWSWKDPIGETREITSFVGRGDRIKLWAKVVRAAGGTGDHQCDMDTLYDGVRKQRWEFDDEEDHEIAR